VREEVGKQIAVETEKMLKGFKKELEGKIESLEKRVPEDIVSIVLFSGDLDKALAAFTIASGAMMMDMKVSMYFTFWGLSAIKLGRDISGKPFMQKMMNLMVPGNSEELGVSKMNFFGAGAKMMKRMMESARVKSLEDMRKLVFEGEGNRAIGCTMSMDVMGIKESEFIDGVELGGVATFMESALRSRTTVFI